MAERAKAAAVSQVPSEDVTAALLEGLRRTGAVPRRIDLVEAATAVLCPLLLRISRGQAEDLLAVFPPALRGLVEPGVTGRGLHGEVFDRGEYLTRIAADLGIVRDEAERIARAVLSAVRGIVPLKEVLDVAAQLPPDIRELWQGVG